jgi:hypothetical protein
MVVLVVMGLVSVFDGGGSPLLPPFWTVAAGCARRVFMVAVFHFENFRSGRMPD